MPQAPPRNPANAPLPDPQELLRRALANEKKLAAEQERYECRVTSVGAELDKTGKAKHDTLEVKDEFYVNGQLKRSFRAGIHEKKAQAG